VLVSAHGGTATYQLTSPTASIVVKANGPCWIEVKAAAHTGQGRGWKDVVGRPALFGQPVRPGYALGDPPHVAGDGNGTL